MAKMKGRQLLNQEDRRQFDEACEQLIGDFPINQDSTNLNLPKEVIIDFLIKNKETFLQNAFEVYLKYKFEYLTFYEFLTQIYFVNYWLCIVDVGENDLYFYTKA